MVKYVLISLFAVIGVLIGYLKIKKDLRIGIERSWFDRIVIPLGLALMCGIGSMLLAAVIENSFIPKEEGGLTETALEGIGLAGQDSVDYIFGCLLPTESSGITELLVFRRQRGDNEVGPMIIRVKTKKMIINNGPPDGLGASLKMFYNQVAPQWQWFSSRKPWLEHCEISVPKGGIREVAVTN